MRVVIDGQSVDLGEEQLLGEGGESRVFALGDRALKVWRLPDEVSAADRDDRARLLELSRSKLARFPDRLADGVVAPTAPVFRAREAAPVGYAMARVASPVPLYRLGQASWTAGRVEPADVTRLLGRLASLVAGLHVRDVVIGDLSETNVLAGLRRRRGLPTAGVPGRASPDWRPYIIDTDSMQFGGLPCPVAQSRTLDPKLYGVDLSAAPVFSPETDWYAFAVLVTLCLLHVHPYGGVHPRYPTLERRAEAGHSVFRGDVALPKVARSPEALPWQLRDRLREVFESGRRDPFAKALLELEWRRCRCGRDFAGARCSCRASQPRREHRPSTIRGRCRAVQVKACRGRLLHVTHRGGLRTAWRTTVGVRRDDSQEAIPVPVGIWPRVRLVGRTTWLAIDRRLEAWRDGTRVASVACDQVAGEPAFDAGAAGAFVVEGGWIVRWPDGQRYGQVRRDQTWLAVGDQLGVGIYRAGRLTVAFVLETERPGLRQVPLSPIEGRLLDLAASFDAQRVLLEIASEHRGARWGRLAVLDRGGRVVAERVGSPEADPALAQTGGKIIAGDRVLYATDSGLRQLHVDTTRGRLVDGARFPDTEPFVTAETRLVPGPGGSVYAVEPRRVTHLTLLDKETP